MKIYLLFDHFDLNFFWNYYLDWISNLLSLKSNKLWHYFSTNLISERGCPYFKQKKKRCPHRRVPIDGKRPVQHWRTQHYQQQRTWQRAKNWRTLNLGIRLRDAVNGSFKEREWKAAFVRLLWRSSQNGYSCQMHNKYQGSTTEDILESARYICENKLLVWS